MAFLLNDPLKFAHEFSVGLAAAYAHRVRTVPGGIVSTHDTAGNVAVVIGGGTGHYPAFGGLVGAGLASGAALGNIFASPSTQQIESVVESLGDVSGVVFSFGNYAGDVLNFRQAAERLRNRGLEVEVIPVTDDISSAAPDDLGRRRGVAGGLIVYKVAGAAAAKGLPLAEVARLARASNAATRTLGVAFSGCTIPGDSTPLFSVSPGRMAVGMGVHGEPGIAEQDLPTSAELADLLVERLLEERQQGSRVVALLNGLGSVSYEELFVLYGDVAARLADANLEVIDAEVGQLITSFDMAGISLTLFWPDSELEALWLAPVDAPAFRHGDTTLANARSDQHEVPATKSMAPRVETSRNATASEASRAASLKVLAALEAMHEVIAENQAELGRLDAVAGDGDHGLGMERGVSAAVAAAARAVEGGAGASDTLREAADAWQEQAGGTSGILWGIALGALAAEFDDTKGPDLESAARGATKAAEQIGEFGRASVGDKTLLDAMVPFAEALRASATSHAELGDAWWRAATIATDAARATADLTPRIGRARPLAARSVGHPDPGAISFALAVNAVANALWPMATHQQEDTP